MHSFKYIVIITGWLFFSFSTLLATGNDEWRARLSSISHDTSISDSIKVVEACKVTSIYANFHRGIGENELDEFLGITLPLADRLDTEDLKILIYGTAALMASDPERIGIAARQCLFYTENAVDPILRFSGWMRLGQLNINKGIGLKYLLRALGEIADYPGDHGRHAEAYRYISVYYRAQLDYRNSLRYARLSLDMALQSGDARTMALSWGELAYCCYETPDGIYWPDAGQAYQKVIRIYREDILPQDVGSDSSIGDNLNYMVMLVNTGLFYCDAGELSTAMDYLNKALEIAIPAQMTETAAFCYKQLGLIYRQQSDYGQALENFRHAGMLLSGDYVRTDESDNLEYEIMLAKAELYDIMGEYRKAAENYRDGIAKYRTVFDAGILLENQKLAAYYEDVRQEEELLRTETLAAFRQRQYLFTIGITVLLTVGLVFTLFVYRYRIGLARQKEEHLKNQMRKLELERSKAELLVRLKQQEFEDIKAKLHESKQLRMLRNAILETLKEFFTSHSELSPHNSRIEAIIMQQNRIESNLEEFRSYMEDVPEGFHERLQEKAGGRLTSLELKYCRLIHLNVSTQDIARLLYVEPRSVRVNKYRMKRKLGLGRNEDLGRFIRDAARCNPGEEPGKNEK